MLRIMRGIPGGLILWLIFWRVTMNLTLVSNEEMLAIGFRERLTDNADLIVPDHAFMSDRQLRTALEKVYNMPAGTLKDHKVTRLQEQDMIVVRPA